MSGEACPLPSQGPGENDSAMQRLLAARRIAVVGISDDPSRASHYVSEYLQTQGYEILGVNPKHAQVLGQPCYPALAQVPQPVDVVLVFRRPEHVPPIAQEAVAIGAKGIWLQSGIRSPAAQRIAQDAAIDFVQDHCMMVEHRRRARS